MLISSRKLSLEAIGGLQPISVGTQITMLQCTIAGGRTKGANKKSFVFVRQHGGYDVT